MTTRGIVSRRGAASWVSEAADRVLAERSPAHTGPLTSASGISPSGPVHLGNLREALVPQFVNQEFVERGLPARHLLSWDDYDRLRKVPAGVHERFAEHIGRPLAEIEDPCGEHASWAEHYKQPFRDALASLGVVVDEISQHAQYTSGAYVDEVRLAMSRRAQIDSILSRHRTKVRDDDAPAPGEYFPYKPYCDECNRDTTRVTAYSDETTELSYVCDHGHSGTSLLTEHFHGKLVWKVDWPMRWMREQVDFEAGGVDHSSPGSSFTVGKQLVDEIFGSTPPSYLGYSFVGSSGAAKMSGSRGGAPTPSDALTILEPALLRWLYARRKPAASFSIDFGAEVARIYDEWDALGDRVARETASPPDAEMHERARRGLTGVLPTTPRPLPFRTLASVYDVSGGSTAQLVRILQDFTQPEPIADLDETRPRLDRASEWVREHLDPEERTVPREEPDIEQLAALDESSREAIGLLLGNLDAMWSLPELTALVYGVPKLQRGLTLDAPPSDEIKVAQRAWFITLYGLLINRDTGPRLPTLLLALGKDRIRRLLAT